MMYAIRTPPVRTINILVKVGWVCLITYCYRIFSKSKGLTPKSPCWLNVFKVTIHVCTFSFQPWVLFMVKSTNLVLFVPIWRAKPKPKPKPNRICRARLIDQIDPHKNLSKKTIKIKIQKQIQKQIKIKILILKQILIQIKIKIKV